MRVIQLNSMTLFKAKLLSVTAMTANHRSVREFRVVIRDLQIFCRAQVQHEPRHRIFVISLTCWRHAFLLWRRFLYRGLLNYWFEFRVGHFEHFRDASCNGWEYFGALLPPRSRSERPQEVDAVDLILLLTCLFMLANRACAACRAAKPRGLKADRLVTLTMHDCLRNHGLLFVFWCLFLLLCTTRYGRSSGWFISHFGRRLVNSLLIYSLAAFRNVFLNNFAALQMLHRLSDDTFIM